MTLTQQELAAVEPDLEQGTNLQHALRLAGRHLRRHPDAEPVVLVVTDGEPTAHLDPDDGEALFHWPPLPETIEATVREVDRLSPVRRHAQPVHARRRPGPARVSSTRWPAAAGAACSPRTPTTSASTWSPTTSAPASAAAESRHRARLTGGAWRAGAAAGVRRAARRGRGGRVRSGRPEGQLSAEQIVAHLVANDELMSQATEAVLAGSPFAYYDLDEHAPAAARRAGRRAGRPARA